MNGRISTILQDLEHTSLLDMLHVCGSQQNAIYKKF